MSKDELVLLVDEHDEVIGQKRRSELFDTDCWRLASVWVENSKGQVLLQQRALTKKLSPGLWSPAADGTVKGNDSYDQTALREVAEEIGMTGIPLQKQNKVYSKMEFGYRQWQGYKAICDWPIEKFTVQGEEVAQLAWVDKQEFLEELKGQKRSDRNYPPSITYWAELFNLS